MNYPISEIFDSIQGEGVYTGTPMRFIRLAGCNVGQYEAGGLKTIGFKADFPILQSQPMKHSMCTSVVGESFVCDTDYHKSESLTLDQIFSGFKLRHVCITGGEPFLHDLEPLVKSANERGVMVHVETSGTLRIPDELFNPDKLKGIWYTCSPKRGYLRENNDWIDEWKVLVGPNFLINAGHQFLKEITEDVEDFPVYLQPINAINEADQQATQQVVDLLLNDFPQCRLSAQLHKYLRLR